MMAEPKLPDEPIEGAARHAEVAIVSISRLSYANFQVACTDVRRAAPVYTAVAEADEVVEQLVSHLTPKYLPRRMKADGSYAELPHTPCERNLIQSAGTTPLPVHENTNAFQETPVESRILLQDVADGKADTDAFLAQLSDDDLIGLLGGQPNMGVADTYGMGNLPQYGVPNIMTADGPAGVRINSPAPVRTTAFPCCTLLACSWDPAVVEAVGAAGGAKLKENDEIMWLPRPSTSTAIPCAGAISSITPRTRSLRA